MKGMDKISRGSGFAGTTNYLQYGSKNKAREYEGIVIGGNVANREANLVARELSATKKIRPDIQKPVWHNSLRLPKGETLTHAKWNEIGDEYMRQMGFSDLHPRAYYLHDDKEGQHIHIVASRIAYNGNLYLGKNENLISTKIISKLEQEFGLTQSKAVEYKQGRITPRIFAKLTKREIEKAVRLESEPARRQLQKMVNEAIKGPTSATHFIELLQAGGVDVRVNIANTGRLNGFKFGLQGAWFSGSKLGKDFTYTALVNKGLDYDKNRDGKFLSRFRSECGDDKSYGRAADRPEKSRPELDTVTKRDSGADSRSEAGEQEYPNSGAERTNTNIDVDLSGKHVGHSYSATLVSPTGGVGPGKSGNKVADELVWAMHKSRLEELRKGIQANQRYLLKIAEQEQSESTQKAADEQNDKAKRRREDAEHEKMVRIAEGFGFAMKTKIKTTRAKKDGTTTTGKKTRKNTVAVSSDAAPRCD